MMNFDLTEEQRLLLAGNTGFFRMDDMEVPAENLVGRSMNTKVTKAK